ncbi:MAG: hypothetical protein EXR72_07350 [Myxococcales bacterium]|nr:hypothetical protein [Myxococcales bacterium]
MSSDHPESSSSSGPKGMSTGGAIIGMLIAAILGFLLRGAIDGRGGGSTGGGGGADVDIAVVPPGAVDPSIDRFKMTLGSAPVRGSATAKVTIVEVSDFQ